MSLGEGDEKNPAGVSSSMCASPSAFGNKLMLSSSIDPGFKSDFASDVS